MKNLHFKTILFLITLISFSCEDPNTLTEKSTLVLHPVADPNETEVYNRWDDSGRVSPLYNGSDSGPIDKTVADSWIENFNITARSKTNSHYFTRNAIDKIISQTGCTGIRIYYALDGDEKLIIAGVDKNGQNILGAVPILAIGGETLKEASSNVIKTDAQTWIENYQRGISSSDIRSHYFGLNAILKVLHQDECAGLRIYYALNHLNEKKLLIVGVTQDVTTSSGRTNSTDITPIVIDFSFPCPSTCGNQSNGL